MFSSYPYHHSPSYGYGSDFGYSAHPRSPQSYYAAAQAERQRRARLQAQAQAQRQALAERQYQARLQAQAQAQAEREARYWAQRRAQPRAFMPEEYDSDPAELDGWGFRPAYHRKQTRSLSPSASLDSQDLHPALHRRQTRSASPPASTPAPARQPPKTISREDQESAASTIQHAYRVHRSLTSITAIERAFEAQKQQFTFPTVIDYQDDDNIVSVSIPALSQSTTSSSSTSPAKAKLAFTSNNKPLHAHMESLSRLLTSLDGVDSWGEKRIRLRRKEVVRKIEQELQDIEGVEDVEDRSREELVKGWRGVWRLHSSQAHTTPEPEAQEEPVSSEEQVAEPADVVPGQEEMEVGGEEQVAEPVNEDDLVPKQDSAIDEEMEVGGEEQVAEPVNEENPVPGQENAIDEKMEVGGEEPVVAEPPVNQEDSVPGQDSAIDEEMEVEEDLVWHDAESFNLDDSEPEYVLVDSTSSSQ